MVRLIPASAKSALFLLPKHRGVQLLTKRRLISEFRRSLQATGVPNAQGFRGHSFRRGAASWAFTRVSRAHLFSCTEIGLATHTNFT